MNNKDVVHVTSLNEIGVIIDSGTDGWGTWYRTDSSGVREVSELTTVKSKEEVTELVNKGAKLAPSTNKMIQEGLTNLK